VKDIPRPAAYQHSSRQFSLQTAVARAAVSLPPSTTQEHYKDPILHHTP